MLRPLQTLEPSLLLRWWRKRAEQICRHFSPGSPEMLTLPPPTFHWSQVSMFQMAGETGSSLAVFPGWREMGRGSVTTEPRVHESNNTPCSRMCPHCSTTLKVQGWKPACLWGDFGTVEPVSTSYALGTRHAAALQPVLGPGPSRSLLK